MPRAQGIEVRARESFLNSCAVYDAVARKSGFKSAAAIAIIRRSESFVFTSIFVVRSYLAKCRQLLNGETRFPDNLAFRLPARRSARRPRKSGTPIKNPKDLYARAYLAFVLPHYGAITQKP